VSQPLVSIVLVTRNGAETLPATLEAIARQRTDFGFEVVAVDSGSTDGSLALLERSTERVMSIAPDSFNHGLTRNAGVECTGGTLVVLLVQDALPASDDWLAKLVAPLRADKRVAGAFCRQQPRPDATDLTKLYVGRWTGSSATSKRSQLEDRTAFERLDPFARLALCSFDNVCSCIRKSVWEQIPFRSTPIAEDIEWARAVLQAGHALEFVPNAVVIHSHDRPARYEFARTYLLHRRLFELFGLRTIPRTADLFRSVVGSLRLHLACERRARKTGGRPMPAGRAVALAVAWPLGQYLGGLSAARGWKPLRLGSV
jgi:rhamnosyltransferase